MVKGGYTRSRKNYRLESFDALVDEVSRLILIVIIR